MNKQPPTNFLSVTLLGKALPSILSLPLIGGRACLDFVNTSYWRLSPDKKRDALLSYSDLLAFALRTDMISSEGYSELSHRARDAPKLAEQAFVDARGFREALTTLIEDLAGVSAPRASPMPSAASLAQLNAAHSRGRASESLVWQGGRLVLRLEELSLDLPWLQIVRDAEELLLSPLAGRLRVCAATGCGRIFLDSSKNCSRRWCSMQTCGNRSKAERFRSRD